MRTVIIHLNNGFRLSAKDVNYINATKKLNLFFGLYTLSSTHLHHVEYR